MSNLRTLRFRVVTVQLPANFTAGQEIPFPDQDDLRNALIEGIETFTDADQAQTAEGLPVIQDTDAPSVVAIIAQNSNDRVKYLPYRPSRAVLLAGQVRQLAGWVITWPQCRARCVADLNNEAPVNLLFGVHFRYPTDVE